MAEISFLKLGLRQDGISKHPIISLIIQSLVSLAMGGYLFWLAAHMTISGGLNIENMLGVTSWMLLLNSFQQHMKNQITFSEIEFLQQLPITAHRVLRIKTMQSILPIFLPSLSILGIPLGWFYSVGEAHQAVTFIVVLIGQYVTIMVITMALALYLGTENERSNTMFMARVGVVVAMGSVALIVILGPTFVGWVAIIMKPIGYLFGTHFYFKSLSTTGLTSLFHLTEGLATSAIAMYFSAKLSERFYSGILSNASNSRSTRSKTPTGVGLVPSESVLVTLVRKDTVTTIRSWRRHVPGVVSSMVLVVLVLVANLRSQSQASQLNSEAVSIVVAIFTSFSVTGIGLVPSVSILAEDYQILGIIRMSGSLRRFVLGKIIFSVGWTTLLSTPFVIILAVLFSGFGGAVLVVMMAAVVSCLVTACAGVLSTAFRMWRGVHPRYRDPVTPFFTYVFSQMASIGVIYTVQSLGLLLAVLSMFLLPVLCLITIIVAESLLEDIDIMG